MAKGKEAQEPESFEVDLKELRKDIETSMAELRGQVKDLKEKAAKTVVERPLLALGVAFAVGMAFGIALSGSRD